MNCQEVTELMQRYLDKDLNETEYSIVLRHIQQCPECTDMFERLQRLSNDLESLPKVTPPYSIVDSIMPRLLEIDRLQAEASPEQGKLISLTAMIDQDKITGENAEHKNMLKRHISWRWVSGVVAAGVILGTFLFQQQPSLRENAGEAPHPQFASRMMNEEVSADPMVSSNSMSIHDQSGVAIPMTESKSESSQMGPSSISPSASSGITEGDVQQSAKQQANGDPSVDQGEVPPAAIMPSARALPEGSLNEEGLRNESDDAFTVSEYQVADVGDSQFFELSSPDHKYIAIIHENEIEIKEIESDKMIFRSEYSLADGDKITLKEWAEHHLVYEVITESGVQHFVIDTNILENMKTDQAHSD